MIIINPAFTLGLSLPQNSTPYLLTTAAFVVVVLILKWAGLLDRLSKLDVFGAIKMVFRSKKEPERRLKSTNSRVPQPVRDKQLFADEVVKLTQKARPVQIPTSSQTKKIQEAFDLLEKNDLPRAKKIFDKYPKNCAALYGLACVLERRNEVGFAIKYYWEAIRADPGHESAKRARQKLSEFQIQARVRQQVDELLRPAHAAKVFLFAEPPEPVALARYLTALSNRDGGAILVGIDPESRKPSGQIIGVNFDHMVDAAWTEYCTAPCLLERLNCSNPTCKILLVYPGLNKPYRVLNDGESELWVPNDSGGIRLATEDESQEMRKTRSG